MDNGKRLDDFIISLEEEILNRFDSGIIDRLNASGDYDMMRKGMSDRSHNMKVARAVISLTCLTLQEKGFLNTEVISNTIGINRDGKKQNE